MQKDGVEQVLQGSGHVIQLPEDKEKFLAHI